MPTWHFRIDLVRIVNNEGGWMIGSCICLFISLFINKKQILSSMKTLPTYASTQQLQIIKVYYHIKIVTLEF